MDFFGNQQRQIQRATRCLIFSLAPLLAFSACSSMEQEPFSIRSDRYALSRFQGSIPHEPAPSPAVPPENRNKSRPESDTSETKGWSFEKPPSLEEVRRTVKQGEAGDQLSQAGERWLYGHGLGTTMLNVGTVIVFPPYALYLLGNAGLALAGYEPVKVTDALPETPREVVNDTFDGIVSVPGRFAALVSGEDFRERTKPSASQP